MSDLALPAAIATPRPSPRRVPALAPMLLPLVGLVVAIGAWWVFTATQATPIARSFTPDRAFGALLSLVTSGRLLPHATASLARIAVGLTLATAVGVPLGVLVARSRAAERSSSAAFQFLR